MGILDEIFAQVGQSRGAAQPGQGGGGSSGGQNAIVIALQELLKNSCGDPTAAPDNAGQGTTRDVAPPPTPASGRAAQETDLINGLNGMLLKLQDSGLDDVIKSWLGTGQNAPVAPKDLGAALGRENVRQAADQAGIPPDGLLTQLSKAIPGLIDRLTPNGRLPNTQEISDMLRKR